MATDLVTTAYRAGSALAQILPAAVTDAVVAAAARAAVPLTPARALILARNIERAVGRPLEPGETRRLVNQAYGAYAKYWVESFRLPTLSAAKIDSGIAYQGYEHLARPLARGQGAVLVLPHLGGWEWGGFWLTRLQGVRVTVVVEPLEPPELYEFFVRFRRELGMNVVPLGPDAGREVLTAVGRGEVVCLLADRDIEGTGVEVEFFGERTTLPPGPAMLALRAGVPVLPTAIYFDGPVHHCVVRPPVEIDRRGRLRDDIARLTGVLAGELERLIEAAPTQWHMMQPNWPSDHEALEEAGFS